MNMLDVKRILLMVCTLYTVMVIKGDPYLYLGCYTDVTTAPDLPYSQVTLATGISSVEACTSHCAIQGWPYSGLQQGTTCHCGALFGEYGRASATQCSVTCNQDSEYCGGNSVNSIYYSIKMDDKSIAWRVFGIHSEAKTFEEARKSCIMQDGDLVVTTSLEDFDTITTLYYSGVQSSETGNKWVWIGLHNRSTESINYEWTDESLGFNETEFASFWHENSTARRDPHCVVLDVAARAWLTAECDTQLPYVCSQNVTGIRESDDSDTTSNLTFILAMSLGLPLFVFCYGGSCLAYTLYKLCKACRRRRAMKRYELIDSDGQLQRAAAKERIQARKFSIIHHTNTKTSVNEPGRSHKRGIPPYLAKSPKLIHGAQIHTAALPGQSVDWKDQDLQDVDHEGDIDEPPPNYYDTHRYEKRSGNVMKDKKERQRNKLLLNALSEARERRRREREEAGHTSMSSLDTIASIASPSNVRVHPRRLTKQNSSSSENSQASSSISLKSSSIDRSTASSPIAVTVKPRPQLDLIQRSTDKNTFSPYIQSNDTVLEDLEPNDEIDPMKMSIVDIMKAKGYAKSTARTKKRKGRGIINA